MIIDAGSSGSRVFIYTWPPHNGISNELLQITPLHNSNKEPLLKKIEPGKSIQKLQLSHWRRGRNYKNPGIWRVINKRQRSENSMTSVGRLKSTGTLLQLPIVVGVMNIVSKIHP